jgi:hypothetical protein
MSEATSPGRLRCRNVADRLGVCLRTVQARAHEIPGSARIFGGWSFDPRQLDEWIADREAQARRQSRNDEDAA